MIDSSDQLKECLPMHHKSILNYYHYHISDLQMNFTDKSILQDNRRPFHTLRGLRYVLKQFWICERCIVFLHGWKEWPWYFLCAVSAEFSQSPQKQYLWGLHSNCKWGQYQPIMTKCQMTCFLCLLLLFCWVWAVEKG